MLVLLYCQIVFRLLFAGLPMLAGRVNEELLISIPVFAIVAWYVARAARAAYGTGQLRSWTAGLAAALLLLPALAIYRMILFFTVYLTLRG